MFKQNEKAISQIAEYIPRACRGMQLQEAKARLEKKIPLYTNDGCDVAVLNAAFAPAINSHTRESIFLVHRRDLTDAHRAIYAYPEAEVNAALASASIKVEAE